MYKYKRHLDCKKEEIKSLSSYPGVELIIDLN